MSDGIKRYRNLGVIARWRMRRAARVCGNHVLPRMEKTYGRRQLFSVHQVREMKRDASLNDYEAAITAGFFLSPADLAAAAKHFSFVLDGDDARMLIKQEVKNLTVLEITTHKADGGSDQWDNKLGRE